MMGKTDAYFCILSYLINKDIRVYTEMMHAETILRSNILDNYRGLKNISKISLQIAGNNPKVLAKASKVVEDLGFQEININCGCPSPRVVSGNFGISLLENPELVSECVNEMKNNVSCKVSIKTRIGINYEKNDEILDKFLECLNKVNTKKYIIHARNAIINKIPTKKNLSIPKLDYNRVFRLKKKFHKNTIIINGGFMNTYENNKILEKVDGIMIGREAYKNPWIFDKEYKSDYNYKKDIVLSYLNIIDDKFKKIGFNFKSVEHLYNIFNSLPGSKKWKQLVNLAAREKKLECLFNYLRYNKLKCID